MIITRAPLRITLGGGGTDLPSYYEREGGFVLSAAINQYIYVNVSRSLYPGLSLYHGDKEVVDSIDLVQHPIIRESLRTLEFGSTPLNIVSTADLPGRTGLGSSGSFTVALLHALHAFRGKKITPALLAEQACDIEINKMNAPVGKQDQYIAAFGGIRTLTFNQRGECAVEQLELSDATYVHLEENLLLYFVGITRDSSSILSEQNHKSKQNDKTMLENLNQIKQIGIESKLALESGSVREFAELMNVHWRLKKGRSARMSNSKIDHLYQFAMDNGALAGKIVGAGGGGFLLLYTENKQQLCQRMQTTDAYHVDFKFDQVGSCEVSA